MHRIRWDQGGIDPGSEVDFGREIRKELGLLGRIWGDLEDLGVYWGTLGARMRSGPLVSFWRILSIFFYFRLPATFHLVARILLVRRRCIHNAIDAEGHVEAQ